MTSPALVNIKRSQDEYLNMIIRYESLVCQDRMSAKDVAMMLDEIKCFWLERLEAIEFELEELADKHSCFLLCGAIYLCIPDYEHYYYKSLGDYHLLFDPLLKMESFFRAPKDRMDSKETMKLFQEVYNDTIEVLQKYKNHFLILPIREIAVKDESEHLDILEKASISFISSLLNKDFKNNEELFSTYQSFEEIENDIDCDIRGHLIFNEIDSTDMSLREKIERYHKRQRNLAALTRGMTESQIFYLSIFTFISQIIDVLLICTYLRVCPYIRFDVSFHYLILVMSNFHENSNLKEMLEKAIVFYIQRKAIEVERFANVKFDDFCKRLENKSLLDVIMNKIHTQGIDIVKGGFEQVDAIISKEFDAIIPINNSEA